MLRKILLVVVAGLWCVDAWALTTVELVGTDLQTRQVQLLSMHDGAVQYFDADRLLGSQEIGELVLMRVVGGDERESVDWQGMVYLTDGQRIRGELSKVGDDGETLYWRHNEIGEVVLSLDEIRRVVLSGNGDGDELVDDGNDRVVMVNGDVVEGFVLGFSEGQVEMQTGDGGMLRLDLDRVATVGLVGVDEDGDGELARVWLRDGSCVSAGELSVSKDLLCFRLGGKNIDRRGEVAMDLLAVRRIHFGDSAGRLMTLNELPMRVVAGGEVFGVNVGPSVDGEDVRLHGPVMVEFELPEGAQRFAGEFVLDGAKGGQRRWADVEVVVMSGDEVLVEGVLNDEMPSMNVNVLLSAGRLRVVLKEGKNGPVMDRVRVRGGMVYVVGQ